MLCGDAYGQIVCVGCLLVCEKGGLVFSDDGDCLCVEGVRRFLVHAGDDVLDDVCDSAFVDDYSGDVYSGCC